VSCRMGILLHMFSLTYYISRQYIILIVNYKENKKKDKGLINKRRSMTRGNSPPHHVKVQKHQGHGLGFTD